MGISIETKTDAWGIDDKSWLASPMGMNTCRSITLDVALFNALHYPEGYIPSGTVLGKVTATGFYGPYSPALANGLDVSAGHLFEAAQVTDGAGGTYTKIAAALYWQGIVRTSKLPNFTGAANTLGELDTNGRADVAMHIRYEDN